MSLREFTITEIRDNDPVRFVWTNENYAAPRGSWAFGLQQRTVREDYPGTEEPVEQVLGPNFTEFDLQGVWDDRYGGNGFALNTYREFEALVQRGTMCRFEFETISVEGLIKEAMFDYKKSTSIGYKFTVSPHRRPTRVSGASTNSRKPAESFTPVTEYRDHAIAAIDFMDLVNSISPAKQMTGTAAADTGGFLDNLRNGVNKIVDAVQQRIDPAVETFESLRRVAHSLSVVKGAAAGVMTQMASMKSSAVLAWDSAVGALDFDVWRTDLNRYARSLALMGHKGQEEMNRRAEPKAVALYRPRKGESLYSISQRFYSTPSMWRLIATRNGLTSMTLQGTELLIIPERR